MGKALLQWFPSALFKKVAQVAVGEPPLEYKKRVHERVLEAKQRISNQKFLHDLALEKKRKAHEKQLAEIERQKNLAEKKAAKEARRKEREAKKAERELQKAKAASIKAAEE